ncbi:hypothetical protein F4808DRAFT_453599 [Astrocystis sublimbata]|nr:hypothetical protein F4808DRAFT_453599 [Astrocystis sublimbata]
MPRKIPVRLIVCVDGTWFDPDGGNEKHGNVSNTYRVYASVAEGICKNASGEVYMQKKIYIAGLGSEDNISRIEKLYDGAFGWKSFDHIKNVYRECCRLTDQDEVWLYGFSRGAYVVRAVAGLLHHLRALISAGLADKTFDQDYKEALKMYENRQKKFQINEGGMHYLFTAKTREAPTIKFVGTFDTVKAVDDKSLYDISFNDSIQHMRAALALNEDRKAMQPEVLWPSWANGTGNMSSRSFLQAWFVGAHINLGGSAKSDGLALYPLQWMLLESQAQGLVLKFVGGFSGRSAMTNPLNLLGIGDSQKKMWSYTTKNGVLVRMCDIRQLHDDKNPIHGARYAIRLEKSQGLLGQFKKPRTPFGDEPEYQLKGYCDFAPQGTIIHPSVYLLTDLYLYNTLPRKLFPCYDQILRCRNDMMWYNNEIRQYDVNKSFLAPSSYRRSKLSDTAYPIQQL